MKNIIISFFGILLIATIVIAQAPDTLWTSVIGASNTDIERNIEQNSESVVEIMGTDDEK